MANKKKGIRIITDETERKRYIQIDLETLLKEPEAVEDYLDGLIAESRRDEPTESHESVVRKIVKIAKRK